MCDQRKCKKHVIKASVDADAEALQVCDDHHVALYIKQYYEVAKRAKFAEMRVLVAEDVAPDDLDNIVHDYAELVRIDNLLWIITKKHALRSKAAKRIGEEFQRAMCLLENRAALMIVYSKKPGPPAPPVTHKEQRVAKRSSDHNTCAFEDCSVRRGNGYFDHFCHHHAPFMTAMRALYRPCEGEYENKRAARQQKEQQGGHVTNEEIAAELDLLNLVIKGRTAYDLMISAGKQPPNHINRLCTLIGRVDELLEMITGPTP